MVDMSRIPDKAMLRVLGMGVADRVSTSTPLEISFSRSLWDTPKRCSSSTTKSPRSLNWTLFCKSLWVPMITSRVPARRSWSVFFCWAAVRNRLSTSTFTGKPRNRLTTVW